MNTAAQRIERGLAHSLVAMCLLLSSAVARADAVTDWAGITEATMRRVPEPAIRLRSAAITQLAVFEAVNAIVGDYEPYLGTVAAPAGASGSGGHCRRASRARQPAS
jgi:hypothetical protein